MSSTALAPQSAVLLERLATEIRWHQEQGLAAAGSMVTHLRAIAEKLHQARESTPNQPTFLEWARREVGYKKSYVYYLLAWRKHVHRGGQTTALKQQVNLDLPERVVRHLVAQARKAEGVGLPAPAGDALERPTAPAAGHPLEGLPRSDYRIVLADPPWQYQSWNGNGTGRVADDHYPTMALDAIKALPVSRICAPDAVLLCWATMPLLREALDVVAAWGFEYRTAFLVWGKLNADRTPAVGFGRYTRSNGELCLLGRRGAGVPPVEGVAVSNLLLSQRGGHSQKPSRQYEIIDQVFGRDAPRVELFARGRMPGWDVWGLEAPEAITPVMPRLALEAQP